MFCRCFFIGLILFSTLTACSGVKTSGEAEFAGKAGEYEQLVIVGTNDFHGYLRTFEYPFAGSTVLAGGAEWFASYIHVLEKKYGDRLILLDGGDIFQGTLESNTFNGKSVTDFYNVLPYRAAAIGNHEFDYGDEVDGGKDFRGAIKARMRESKFPFLSSNIYYQGTSKTWKEENLFATTEFIVKGIKVAVIGLTTESTPSKARPQYIADLEFRSLTEAVKREGERLRSKGIEVLLIAAHEGGEKDGEPMNELLGALPLGFIDAVVAGHSHTQINEMVHGVPVIESKTQGLYFGRIDLFVDKKSHRVNQRLTKIHTMHPICGTWFKSLESCDVRNVRNVMEKRNLKETDMLPLRKPIYEGVEIVPDLNVRNILQPYFAKVDELQKEVIAYATRDFKEFVTGETEVGQLFASIVKETYPNVKAVFFNGGGFRKMILQGPITYGNLFQVHPFDNKLVLLKIKGRDLKKMVRIATSGHMKIPAVHGFKFKFHDKDTNPELKWRRNRLVSIEWDDGLPILDTEDFWLATSDYLLDGGDHMDEVLSGLPVGDPNRVKVEEINVRDIIANYMRENRHSYPVKEPKRITMIQ